MSGNCSILFHISSVTSIDDVEKLDPYSPQWSPTLLVILVQTAILSPA